MKEYKTITKIAGPLVFVEGVEDISYGEIVEIQLPTGEKKKGQVLDTQRGLAVVQVFGTTAGINLEDTSVKFLGETMQIGVSG